MLKANLRLPVGGCV